MKSNKFKNRIFTLLFLSLILSFTSFATISCATTKNASSKLQVIEKPERMFWEIKKGKASIFVLGTIHIADKSFYPIEDNILKAFDSADELYSEIGGIEEMKQLPMILQKKMIDSMNPQAEKNLSNFISKEDLALLYKEFGETNIRPLLAFDPWVLALLIPEMLYQKSGMDFSNGIDNYFMARANGRKINALETLELQFNALSSGSFETQLRRLNEAIDSLKNYDQSMEEMRELRRAYLENDKKAANKLLTARTKIKNGMTDAEYDAYINELITKRNIAWAKTFDELLGDGKTEKKIFVFAGTGHFIGENSVFNYLKK